MQLTTTQRLVLSKAARREDRAVILPAKIKGGAAQNVLDKLLKSNLVEEIQARRGLPIWRRDEQNRGLALRITKRGQHAVLNGCKPKSLKRKFVRESKSPATRLAAGVGQQPNQSAPVHSHRAGSKKSAIIEMLHHPNGATVSVIANLVGWQPHSVRGFLSRVVRKDLGLHLVAEKNPAGRVYRIAAA